MSKYVTISCITFLFFVTVACSPVENQARDTAAGLSGAIVASQTQYMDSCTKDKTQPVCVTINKAVSGQNALVTAIETYCGWPVTPVLDNLGKCVPVKSAEGALRSAISNANVLTTEIKGTISGAVKP